MKKGYVALWHGVYAYTHGTRWCAVIQQAVQMLWEAERPQCQ